MKCRKLFSVLLILALLVSQAGAASSSEDREIRAAMAGENFGYGTKLACYDWTTDTYSYDAVAIPEEMRAKTPEEIGGFISYHPADLDEDGMPKTATTLHFAFNPEVSYMVGSMGSDFDITCMTDDPRLTYDSPWRDEGEGGFWDKLWRFYQNARPVLLYMTQVYGGHEPQPGTGNRMIARDVNTGEYNFRFVPREMVARSDEELGFLMEYTITRVEASGEYGSIGTIRGHAERFDYTIRDLRTGEVIDEYHVGGGAPFVIFGYNGDPDNGFDEQISPDEVVMQILSNDMDRIGDGEESPDRW